MEQSALSRRQFLRLSATAVGMLAVTACVPAQQGGAAPAASDGAAAAPAGEKVTVTNGLTWEAAFQNTQAGFDKAFMERHPDITIENVYNTWSDHNTVVPTWAAAGTLPDMIYVHGSRAFPWAFEGITVNIQDKIDADNAFNVKGIWEEALRLYRFKGNLHGIPYDHGPIILGYNKDIFDAAGVAYPNDEWTMDTLRETAKQLTKLDGDQPQWGWGGNYPALGNTESDNAIGPWGQKLLNDDETELLIDTDETRAALQFWTDMIHVDKSAPTPAEAQGFQQGAWTAGRVAMVPVASWDTPTYAAFTNFKWDVTGWPAGTQKSSSSFGSGFSITRDSKHVDQGWTFLSEYLSTDGMIEMWGRSGRGSPARKDAYQSWIDSDIAPDNAKAFLDALDSYAVTGRPYQTLAAGELGDIIGRNMTLLRSGEGKVEDAVATIMTEGTAVLKAATERMKG